MVIKYLYGLQINSDPSLLLSVVHIKIIHNNNITNNIYASHFCKIKQNYQNVLF